MFSCFSRKAVSTRQCQLDVTLHQIQYIEDNYLNNITYKDTVPYVHQLHRGKVIKVYDGDTITIAAKLLYLENSPIYRFSIRLRGIDTPEIKTKSLIEKEFAEKAQHALSDLILHKIVYLTDVGMDKYGRVLANVYYEKINISKWMLEKGYAVEYNGKTKQIPDEWK